jgi:TRAP-type C4-dicarboxylate transport system permease small subunit
MTRGLRRGAEGFMAALLVAMFVAFIIQIVFRYIFNWPIGWTTEVCVVTWLWIVLWGSSVAVGEASEIRFDIVYESVPGGVRRWFTIVGATVLIVLYGISLPASVSYIAYMKVEKTAYTGVRFDYVFSIYVLFAVASIARFGWIIWRSLRQKSAPGAIEN